MIADSEPAFKKSVNTYSIQRPERGTSEMSK